MPFQTSAHGSTHCLVCFRYLNDFRLFCSLNKVEIEYSTYPVDVFIINFCCGRRRVVIDQDLPQSDWLPAACKILGVPSYAKAHYCYFVSLN